MDNFDFVRLADKSPGDVRVAITYNDPQFGHITVSSPEGRLLFLVLKELRDLRLDLKERHASTSNSCASEKP